MSTSFGPSNLFGGAGDSSKNTSFAPTLGLRQRPSAAAAAANTNIGADENANPNNAPSLRRDNTNMKTTYGKWGSMSRVPAPPRASLSTAGKYNVSGRSATGLPQQQQRTENRNVGTASHQALVVPAREKVDVDLSLWVVGYGYRSEAHFRELYQRLERCGSITARRGGLSSCFGEGITDSVDKGNWVAVQYESALCAQKALCQHGNFVSLGGSTMIMGVMPLRDAAAQLGINVDGSLTSKRESVALSGSYNKRHQNELRSEEDIMLYANNEQGGGNGTVEDEVKSSLDSLCGKVLAWFFMWDTHA